jgi:type IV secretion system protein VirB8
MVTMLRDGQTTYGEVVDKYFLNKYVLNREAYDYETVQTAYDTTVLLSSPEVQREYLSLFEGPKARQEVLSNHTRIVVKVRSITPGTSRNTAVVRFSATRKQSSAAPDAEESFVATIGFRYVGAAMREQDRLVNPLGFQATSYRVDPEVVGGG